MSILGDDFMREQMQALPSAGEILRSFLALDPADWMMLTGGAMWLILLRLPLHAIDRRDHITGGTYLLFLITSGVILTIALPARLSKSSDLNSSHITAIGIMATLSVLRWSFRPRQESVAVAKAQKEKEVSP